MDAATAHREWTVTGELTGRTPGTGIVTVRLINGRLGALPPIDVHVGWKAGMETPDVEMFAIGLIADGAQGLVQAAIEAAGRRGAQAG